MFNVISFYNVSSYINQQPLNAGVTGWSYSIIGNFLGTVYWSYGNNIE